MTEQTDRAKEEKEKHYYNVNNSTMPSINISRRKILNDVIIESLDIEISSYAIEECLEHLDFLIDRTRKVL